MSYGEGIGISFWIGLLSSVISSLFTYIYIKFFDASFVEMIKEKQIEEMQARGMSDEQIDQGMKFAEMFMSPEAILIFGIIGGIITVLIVGLIVTIFTQKKSPEPGF
jgi:ABC-type antimicrobial peptide transport system permease subunit